MRQEPSTVHIPPEELADYFDAALSEEREGEIEEHLAECTECTEEARRLHTFSSVWDSWTARAHGEAYQRSLLAGALQRVDALVQNVHWRQRLVQWRTDLTSRAGATLRVVMQAGEHALSVLTEGLDALVPPAVALQSVPVRGPVRTRGSRVRGRGVGRTTVPLTPDTPQARVEVKGETGEVEVRVEALPPGRWAPLVLLIPTTTEDEPRVKELEHQADGVDVARFEGVTPGDYLVAIEPAR